jgi:hypothetical protein
MLSKVFLGGTCNGTTWREELIPLLEMPYFNPVVKDWTEECQVEEYKQKEICDIHLYVITQKMTGVFSIAEAVDSANRVDKFTVFVVDPDGFGISELKSLEAVKDLINKRNGTGIVTSNMQEVADLLNSISPAK